MKGIRVYCYDINLGEIVNKVFIEFSVPIDLPETELEDLDIILHELFGNSFKEVDIEAEYEY